MQGSRLRERPAGRRVSTSPMPSARLLRGSLLHRRPGTLVNEEMDGEADAAVRMGAVGAGRPRSRPPLG